MSRDLPRHPNLDQLKKQAKELLRELQHQNPEAILADAQHQLAREYGFASWPKLKAWAGEFEGRVEYVVSPDGHSLTLSASWRGGIEQVGVFDRAKL